METGLVAVESAMGAAETLWRSLQACKPAAKTFRPPLPLPPPVAWNSPPQDSDGIDGLLPGHNDILLLCMTLQVSRTASTLTRLKFSFIWKF